jgi:DNA primase
MNKIIDILDSLGIEYKDAKGDSEVRVNCPMPQCTGRDFKLWINPEKRIGQCFRCGTTGTARYFIKRLGGVLEEEKKSFKLPTKEPIKLNNLELPNEYKSLVESPSYLAEKARDYLYKRGVTKNDIFLYNIGYCPTGKLAGYIILPVRGFKEKPEGWQGRKFMYNGSKSMNPVGGRGNLFGLQHCIVGNDLIIVEGPFDVMAINRLQKTVNCVGLLGHSLSNLQASIIRYMLKPKTIYIMLDWDVNEDEYGLASELVHYGIGNVKLCQLTKEFGDPDQLKEDSLKNVLENAKRFTETDSMMRRLKSV